jgi:hypothetical protein
MNKAFKISTFLLISLIAFSNLFAQHNTNSPYSRYGIGDLESNGFGMNKALGGIQAGLRSSLNVNMGNPASYTSFAMQHFIFEVGISDKMTSFKSQGQREKHHSANVAYVACGFPITKWWKSSIGLKPYSSVGYNIEHSIIKSEGSFPQSSFTSTFVGEGGINQLYMGHAFTPFKNFSVGFNVSYLFGTINHTRQTNTYWYNTVYGVADTLTFVDASQMVNLRTAQIKDIMLNYGVQYSFTTGKTDITIGATFDNKKNVQTDFYDILNSQISVNNLWTSSSQEVSYLTTQISETESATHITLPKNLGIGFTVNTPKFLFGADYYQQDWTNSQFLVDDKYGNYTKSDRISAGLQFTPGAGTTKYWKTVSYRIGGHFANTGLQVISDNSSKEYEKIKDFGISFGAQLGIPRSSGIVDFSVEIGKRGRDYKNLIEERYTIFHLNFNLHEFWFIKPKFD